MVVCLSGNLSMGLEQCRLKMKLKKKITGSNSDVFFSSETELVQSGKTQVTRGMSFYQKTFVDFSPLFVLLEAKHVQTCLDMSPFMLPSRPITFASSLLMKLNILWCLRFETIVIY